MHGRRAITPVQYRCSRLFWRVLLRPFPGTFREGLSIAQRARPASRQLLQAENGMRMHVQLANAWCFESFCNVCMQLDAMPALVVPFARELHVLARVTSRYLYCTVVVSPRAKPRVYGD